MALNSRSTYIPSCSDILEEEELVLLSMTDKEKKRKGVFFTPAALVDLSFHKLKPVVGNETYFDPACGTGNLLVRIAGALELSDSLEETLINWNQRLFGLDTNKKFVDITKKKIIRLAVDRGCNSAHDASLDSLMGMLTNIQNGNFIREYRRYIGQINNIIMNPPFCLATTPRSISWSSGQLNAAALFVYYAASILSPKGKVIGILPDVIRSGSRYIKLRDFLKNVLDFSVEPYGEFHKSIQVNVFILEGTKLNIREGEARAKKSPPRSINKLIEDDFLVSVGPVVPHRDEMIGSDSPYVHVKTLPAWKEVSKISERITHKNRKFISPFVAIRRTSSPKDKYRVIGTIINCKEPVAVENHIIVISPKNGDIESCRELLKYLSTTEANDYINSQIRCRHLTVGVVKSIPLEDKADGN